MRRRPVLREMVAETRLAKSQLVQPHFVLEDASARVPIDSMPGIERMGIEPLLARVGADLEVGLTSVLLFGLTEDKDAEASAATDPDGVVPRAVRRLRAEFGDALTIATDVCLCGATDHGHCGVLRDGYVQNDESLPLLSAAAAFLVVLVFLTSR